MAKRPFADRSTSGTAQREARRESGAATSSLVAAPPHARRHAGRRAGCSARHGAAARRCSAAGRPRSGRGPARRGCRPAGPCRSGPGPRSEGRAEPGRCRARTAAAAAERRLDQHDLGALDRHELLLYAAAHDVQLPRAQLHVAGVHLDREKRAGRGRARRCRDGCAALPGPWSSPGGRRSRQRRGRARRPPLIDKSSGHCQGPTSRLACPAAAAWPRRPTPTRRTASAALRRNADRPRMARKRARTVTHDPRRYQHSGYVSMPSSLICGGDGRGCGVYAAPWCTRG